MFAKAHLLLWIELAWLIGTCRGFTTKLSQRHRADLSSSPTRQQQRCRTITAVLDSTSVDKNDVVPDAKSSGSVVYKHLLEHFQGEFDNYRQVLEDRARGLAPREGGGHENFHCTLIPLEETSRLAAFFFDGNPKRIFRFRYYELSLSSPTIENCIEMNLYTLHPKLEKELRSKSEDPLSWPAIFASFEVDDDEGGGNDESSEKKKIRCLPNCEIRWSVEMDPVEHAYALEHEERQTHGDEEKRQDGIHAVMIHGQAVVDSTIIPGMKIRILDQLSLYEDAFYINDRGLDPATGAFIYGNQRGVPYRLDRVTRFFETNDEENNNGGQRLARHVVDRDLQWTMGESWRSSEEYDAKMNAIGGPSAAMNNAAKKAAPAPRFSSTLMQR